MKTRRLCLLFAVTALLLGQVSCSEEATQEPPAQVFLWDTIGKESLDALTLSPAKLGFGYFPGDNVAFNAVDPDSSFPQKFSTVFIRSQMSDELKIGQEGPNTAAQALFSIRTAEIQAELDAVRVFNSLGLVLDVMRLSDGSQANSPEPYLTTWDDKLNRTIDNYGFYRDEYRVAFLEQVKTAAQNQRPAYLIVGAEMERFLAVPGGLDDYANFITLYREAYDIIKSVSPSTKVGAGIDWVRFQEVVARDQVLVAADLPDDLKPATKDEVITCNALPQNDAQKLARLQRACTDKAFMAYVEPLLRYPNPNYDPENPAGVAQFLPASDILALSLSAPSQTFEGLADNCPDDFFGYLRLWSQAWPVVYYQTNWQISSSVSENKQGEWFDVVVARNQGVNVEVFAWANLKDLKTNPDCNKLKSSDIGAPDWMCFQGLFSESGRAKDVFTKLTSSP